MFIDDADADGMFTRNKFNIVAAMIADFVFWSILVTNDDFLHQSVADNRYPKVIYI